MELTLITDSLPEQEPISATEAKEYLRYDGSDSDNSIQGMIAAARMEAENENGHELSVKQWRLTMDGFPCNGLDAVTTDNVGYRGRQYRFVGWRRFLTLLDPLVSVESFTYRKADGTTVTLAENTDYIVDSFKHPGIICLPTGKDWPSDELWPTSSVQVTFTAGCTPAMCYATIKQGVLLLVSQWFEGRIPFEAVRYVGELPYSVTSLFRNGKLWRF